MAPDQTTIRAHADTILRAGLAAVDPAEAVRTHLSIKGNILTCGPDSFNLADYTKILAIGAGKAGAPMAAAIEEMFGDLLHGGTLVVKDGHTLPLNRIKILEAGHPVPDSRSIRAAGEIMRLVKENAGEKTLFINLLSGGASSLLAAPAPGIILDDKQRITQLLLECGAEIHEINTVRKHLSAIKGGNLALAAVPSTMISLLISDVTGDRPDTIGSGPAFPDATTWSDAYVIMEKYGLWEKAPESVKKRIKQGMSGRIKDTPSEHDGCFRSVTTCIIASNRQALLAAADTARKTGYATLVLSSSIQGETREIARMHGAIAREILNSGNPLRPPCCIISGGETTVTMTGVHGKGGRNQEFALAAAIEIAGLENLLILSAGTDGTDGPTDAAGAAVTGETMKNAAAMNLDAPLFLQRHDAYHFFKKTGELVITGPTMTNVMDMHVILAEK